MMRLRDTAHNGGVRDHTAFDALTRRFVQSSSRRTLILGVLFLVPCFGRGGVYGYLGYLSEL